MNQECYGRLRTLVSQRMNKLGLPPGARVLVCVSGGADSVCLLRLLNDLGLPLGVFHLDHGTREGASAIDAIFVKALTESLGLPFHSAVRDVPAEVSAQGISLEEAGRNARYAEAAALAEADGYGAIATAHHAGDQAETVLMRILRGSGLKGLAGIPAVRNGSALPCPIIRPLMDCTRADIIAALEEIGQEWRHDDSNDDPAHLRNRIRHDLLPHLRTQFNPGIDDALVRLAESARADDTYLDHLAREFLDACTAGGGAVNRTAFAEGDRALQRRAAALILAEWGIEPAFERIDAIRVLIAEGATGAAYDIDGVLFYNNRALTEIDRDTPVFLPPVPLAIPGDTRIHGAVYRVRLRTREAIGDPRAYCSPRRQVFDADAFLGDAAVRGRVDGDRFRPLGLNGEKKLKDWFIDQGVTRRARAEQHLVTVDDRIVWVVGYAIDAHAAVTGATRRVVEIEVLE